MTREIVPASSKIKKNQSITLADIQNMLDERAAVQPERVPVNTKAARVAEAKRRYELDPTDTLAEIQDRAKALADTHDGTVTLDNIPLSQEQINMLSAGFYEVSKIRDMLDVLEANLRALIFAHLDEQFRDSRVRPPHQVPGKVEATGPGSRYVFERRGGNRKDPTMNLKDLLPALPESVRSLVFKTVHHPAVEAWDEENVFDESVFGALVEAGVIDLESLRDLLTPGDWRTPAFYKTLVEED